MSKEFFTLEPLYIYKTKYSFSNFKEYHISESTLADNQRLKLFKRIHKKAETALGTFPFGFRLFGMCATHGLHIN